MARAPKYENLQHRYFKVPTVTTHYRLRHVGGNWYRFEHPG